MRELFGFIKNIGSFCRFWISYEITGDEMSYIIEQYQKILWLRTRCLSKPTYSADTVVSAIDEWYERVYEEQDEKEKDQIESFELELDDFCEGCGEFSADVTKIDVSTMEDMFEKTPKFRTYIKCTKCEVCRHVANKVR